MMENQWNKSGTLPVFKIQKNSLHLILEDDATESKNRRAGNAASCDRQANREAEAIPVR